MIQTEICPELDSGNKEKIIRLETVSWGMYDWANSAFATVILTAIFSKYFAQVVAGGERGVEIFGINIHGAALWDFIVAIAMLIVAIISPILGAIADFSAKRRTFQIFFCYLGVIFSGLLFFVGAGDYLIGSLFFIFALIGFSASIVFNDSFLIQISTEKNIGRISSLGWGLGYIGGGLLLLINLIMLQFPNLIGLPKDYFTVQDCFLSVAMWWFIFSIPAFMFIKEKPIGSKLHEGESYRFPLIKSGVTTSISIGVKRLNHTFKSIKQHRELFKFLLAFLIYNDGIETVIIMASIFGAEVVKMDTGELILYFLMIQGIAFIGSIVFGHFADAAGKKTAIIISLIIWCFVSIWAYFLGIIWDMKTEYWILGMIAATVLGGSQAISRSFCGALTPHEKAAEFFGFYAISGRFATIFGPLIYGLIIHFTKSIQAGILSVIIFFIVGMLILFTVNEEKGVLEKNNS
ncbi:MAG: MFS transporter [Nitrospinae bacterium]|nr:MFS transporter [Nitrospinota bacterium]